MADNYVVNYDINVRSQDAVLALQRFQTAITNLSASSNELNRFRRQMEVAFGKISKMATTIPALDIDTSKINTKLDAVITKLQTIHKLSNKSTVLNAGTGTPANGGSSNVNRRPSRMHRPSVSSRMPKNLGYRVLGPTPLDVGGIMGVDFLKGMGIAYGISGIGSMMGNVIRDAVEYDNIMQTAKNILKTHDKKGNFGGRFANMSQTIRDVGVETKFTAPQVASAAKFLAMAGFNIGAINQSIRPISDIALIGDTDLGETADVVTNIMTGYGISPDRIRKAADIMTMTFTASNTTLMEIAEAYKYSASLLSAGGVDFEEATAGLGILGDAGIKGSQAGTTMRTIMANIVNPTKKQAAAWSRTGVSRFDSSGNMRPLLEIFKDLANADLSLTDFYQMFHKTAAQGAVSLANNVEKWNDIIKENFMSGGIAKKLADEKKNTIAGLWNQLTSQFTENSMKAFETVQQPIKNFLNEIIGWLQQDSIVEEFKVLANDMMEFAHMLKGLLKDLLEWYKVFKPIIKFWAEFQLAMMPALTAIKMFKAALLGVAGVAKFGTYIIGTVNKIQLYVRWLRRATSAQQIFNNTSNRSGGIGGLPIGRGRGSFGQTAIGLGGGILGTWAGAEIGEAVGGTVGSGIGALAGGIGGTALLALAGTGPAGWIAAGALGVTALGVSLYNCHVEAKRAKEEFEKFANATRLEDGVLVGKGLSPLEEHLNLMYNKELSIHDIILKRIQLREKELGITNPSNTVNDVTAIDRRVFGKHVEGYQNIDHWYTHNQRNYQVLSNLGSNGKKIVIKNGRPHWVDASGNAIAINNPKGWAGPMDALTMMAALYQEGAKGSHAKKIKDDFQGLLAYTAYNGGKQEDFDAIFKNWDDNIGNFTYDQDTHPAYFAYGPNDQDKFDAAKISNAYPYKEGIRAATALFYGPDSNLRKFLPQYFTARKTGKLTEEETLNYLKLIDPAIFGSYLMGFEPGQYDQWAEQLGFKTQEDGKKTFVSMGGSTALNVAMTARATLSDMIQRITRLSSEEQAAVTDFMAFATKLQAYASTFIEEEQNGGKSNIRKEGSEMTLPNGITYRYSGGKWVPISGQGYGALSPLSDAEFMQQLNGGTGNGKGGGGGNGVTSGDYASRYKNNSAAPKQVIVKIENLMNVESIDLSNPDNSAVIADLKGQLAQVLIDVVHDFDATYHNS